MARKRIVSRSIKAVVYDVLCLNVETAEPFNTEITLNAAVKGKDVMKKIRSLVDSETVKAVHVVGETAINKVLAMDEEDFIANAYEITPKELEENEEVSE